MDQALNLWGRVAGSGIWKSTASGVYKREGESTTGIGEGIAIPHCKSDAVIKPGLAALVIPEMVLSLIHWMENR